MTQINNRPYWKVLNEQRTQGEWKLPEQEQKLNEYTIVTDDMTICTILAIDIDDEEGLANAQYTALAVNNLASLAEALQLQIDEWHSVDSNFHKEEPPSLKAAREALNRIS